MEEAAVKWRKPHAHTANTDVVNTKPCHLPTYNHIYTHTHIHTVHTVLERHTETIVVYIHSGYSETRPTAIEV